MQSIRHLISITAACLVTGLALGAPALAKSKSTPNCDINGKQVHYKNKATCEKKKGKWLEADTSSAGTATSTSMGTSGTPASGSTATSPAATSPGTNTDAKK